MIRTQKEIKKILEEQTGCVAIMVNESDVGGGHLYYDWVLLHNASVEAVIGTAYDSGIYRIYFTEAWLCGRLDKADDLLNEEK